MKVLTQATSIKSKKNTYIKSNWRFAIKMVSCCSLVNQLDATYTLNMYFNNSWTKEPNFVAGPFIRCWTVKVNEQKCEWSLIKLHATSILFSKVIFVITFLHVFAWFHSRHSFPVHSSSTSSVKSFNQKLDNKDGMLKKLSSQMVQYLSSRHSVNARITLNPRLSPLLYFLPTCKSNW